MSSRWTDARLGDVVTLQRGHDLPDSSRRPGTVPVIGSFGLTGWHDCAKAAGPGVTVGRSGASMGTVSYVASPYWPLNTALYAVDFHGNDERFVYYLLRSIDFQSLNSGSAQPSLNRNYVHELKVRIPELATQRRIGAVLGVLDSKLDNCHQVARALDDLGESLFVALEIERAARTGWIRARLGDVAIQHRVSIDPRREPGQSFDHYSIPAYDNREQPRRQLGREIKSNKFSVVEDSVLLSKLNPQTPRVWWPSPSRSGRSIASTEFMVLTPTAGLSLEYLYFLLKSQSVCTAMESMVTGTSGSHQRVPPEAALAIDVFVPPAQTVLDFTRRVRPMVARQVACRAESQAAQQLLDLLLPPLIDGSLEVSDA